MGGSPLARAALGSAPRPMRALTSFASRFRQAKLRAVSGPNNAASKRRSALSPGASLSAAARAWVPSNSLAAAASLHSARSRAARWALGGLLSVPNEEGEEMEAVIAAFALIVSKINKPSLSIA